MTPTPLSEAIRLGGTLGPQCFNRLAMVKPLPRAAANHSDGGSSVVDSIPYDDVLFTCALGGCLAAMGVPEKTLLHDGMLDRDYFIEFWPSVREVPAYCPVGAAARSMCAGREVSILDLIVHLNDSHHLNRDEIADIVRPFDEAVAQPFTPYRVALSPLYATPDYATPDMVTFSAAEMKALNDANYAADMAAIDALVYEPVMFGEAKEDTTRTSSGVKMVIERLYAEMRQRQLDILKFTPTPKFLLPEPLVISADHFVYSGKTWPLKAELVT